MTDFQRCQMAATAPACPEKAIQLTPRHLELIRAAAEAHRRALDTRAIGPEWLVDYNAWLCAAEKLAVAIIYQAEWEARHG